MSVYKNLKVSDLRDIARSRGLRGWSKLRKDNLISFISDNEEYSTDRATEDARKMGKKTIKELKTLARVYDVKIRSKANKNEIIYLLGENYGEKRRAYFERKIGSWESEIKANEETIRWSQEIDEEERSRKPDKPARPELIKGALNGRAQKWFVDGSGYKDPSVFLYDIEDGVRKAVDNVSGPRKVGTNFSCVLAKEDPRTGVSETAFFEREVGLIPLPLSLVIRMRRCVRKC